MTKVIGIDPGTKSFDFCGLDNDTVILNKSIPSDDVSNHPEMFVETIKSIDADLIIGPSGYGLPVKRLSELVESDFFLLTLVKPEELDKISVLAGMQKSLAILAKEDIPMYFIPGVIHLPTVPEYRKLNKIDMGTADKLCCAVLGIWDQARISGVGYNETSFILLEIGFGYTSAIAVEDGQIVDGVGGTTGAPGFVSLGSMDAELSYLLGDFEKTLLFQGGASSLAGGDVSPERLAELADTEERYGDAWNCLIEGAVRDVFMLMSSVKEPREVLISGRLSRIERITEELTGRLSGIAPVRKVEGFSNEIKEAAQGAAIVANGLADGKYMDLVENMKLREAEGTALDYIRLDEAEGLRKRYLG
ncbi:MAG: DUF1464 family protein [Candidatus Altiarchaeota archaeon]|nr:DUF1464 family protein [Candidatus Altiarchaeota archaeon]